MDLFKKVQVKEIKIGDRVKYTKKYCYEIWEVTSIELTKSGKRIKLSGHAALLPSTEILLKI